MPKEFCPPECPSKSFSGDVCSSCVHSTDKLINPPKYIQFVDGKTEIFVIIGENERFVYSKGADGNFVEHCIDKSARKYMH